ncbi:hypothetical protein [Paenibacillus whitsoniae]|uniref:Phytanoyl-CoA dioxygenase n=1 Tax=Paenibacillus whitsoniae TaxID=2496558 RepID=A0A3S0I965_9BACL|nr:hypothetical protein [Paenibacillus whitsoniae]RTE07916.1 hypothetical protein EJQ19_19905 [Paenibacillus whitsoniae]
MAIILVKKGENGMNLYINPTVSSEEIHNKLYAGDLLVFTNKRSALLLVEYARELIAEVFGELNPLKAQEAMTVEEFVKIVGPLKSKFTNSPRTKELVKGIMEELDYDLTETYFDVPRLRIVTHDNYLSSGVGYAYKPHRDTWYGSPVQQVNYWLPVFDITSKNGLAFYPKYWNEKIANTSSEFSYKEWVEVGRNLAISQIKTDTRKHPLPSEEIAISDEMRFSCSAAEMVAFSASHLHGTVPNQAGFTRFSIDFRVVKHKDLKDDFGAPHIDNDSKGTTLGDFLRGSDLGPIPRDIVSKFE